MKVPLNIIVSGDSSHKNDDIIHVVFTDNSVYKFNYKRRIYHFKFWLLTGMSLEKVMGDTKYLMINLAKQNVSETGL